MPYYPEHRPAPAGEEEKTPKKERKRGTGSMTDGRRLLAKTVVSIVSCALIIYGGVNIGRYIADLSASRRNSRELREIHDQTDPGTEPPTVSAAPAETAAAAPRETSAPSAKEARATGEPAQPETPAAGAEKGTLEQVPYPDNPRLSVNGRFTALRRKSGYIVGWLKVDQVEEAVALKDNTFFLDHDVYGKRNRNGAIFMDSSVSLLTRPYTVLMYGHNMKSGHMFGRLKKYLERNYFYAHRIITFDSLYEEGEFAVFAAARISTVPGMAGYYDLWSLDSRNREERGEAIRKLEKLSAVDGLLDVREDEQIIVLVTCIDEDTDRLVVAARRLRKGETENTLVIRQGN